MFCGCCFWVAMGWDWLWLSRSMNLVRDGSYGGDFSDAMVRRCSVVGRLKSEIPRVNGCSRIDETWNTAVRVGNINEFFNYSSGFDIGYPPISGLAARLLVERSIVALD